MATGKRYRVISDHLGSVRLVVDIADGTVVQRLEYDSFGRVMLDTLPSSLPRQPQANGELPRMASSRPGAG